MKKKRRARGRKSDLCSRRVVSPIPHMPTHIELRINAVGVYSQCKTLRAELGAKSTSAPAPHKHTPVTSINSGHLRT